MLITFSKKLYALRAVNEAVDEFKELADFKISENKNKINVTLKNIDNEVKDAIRDEFCNFVLFSMKR